MLDDCDLEWMDILYEYFVLLLCFVEFVEVCKDVILVFYQQFLNIILCYVNIDWDSVLVYVIELCIVVVMLFFQEKIMCGEVDMVCMIEVLIDCVIVIGGSYYLFYWLYVWFDQLQKVYF